MPLANQTVRLPGWWSVDEDYQQAGGMFQAVLTALVKHENWERHTGWVGNQRLAMLVGRSTETVKRAIRYWRSHGFLFCNYRWDAGWRRSYHVARTIEDKMKYARAFSVHSVSRLTKQVATKGVATKGVTISDKNSPLPALTKEVTYDQNIGSPMTPLQALLKNERNTPSKAPPVPLPHPIDRVTFIRAGRFTELEAPHGTQ